MQPGRATPVQGVQGAGLLGCAVQVAEFHPRAREVCTTSRSRTRPRTQHLHHAISRLTLRPAMTPRIALITDASRPRLTADDALLAEALGADFELEVVAWDQDGSVGRLRACQASVIRSPWNYFDVPKRFDQWLVAVRAAGVNLLNDVATVRWNADKIYLREVEQRGHCVLPTVWLDRHGSQSQPAVPLRDLLHENGFDRAIVKPRVSATAKGLFATSFDTAHADQPRLDALLESQDAMLQPFAAEVIDPGEWSLMFFGGRFSHAVLKTPKPGDHRVQSDFGGTNEPAQPPPAVLDDAQRLVDDVGTLDFELGDPKRGADSPDPDLSGATPRQSRPPKIPNALLYARVDGLERDGRLLLMELELIEPELFFRHDQLAAGRFRDALLEILDRGMSPSLR